MNITHDDDVFGINFDEQDKVKLFQKFISIGDRFRANEIPMDAVSVEYFVVYKDAVNYGFAQPSKKNVEKPLQNQEITPNFTTLKGIKTLLMLPVFIVVIALQPLVLLQSVLMKLTDKLIQSNNK